MWEEVEGMWLVGCSEAVDQHVLGGRPLWGGRRPVWIVEGRPEPRSWRVVADAGTGCRLAVVGDCYASDADLGRGLDLVAAAGWRALTEWPGSYWVVTDDGSRTVVLTDIAGTRSVYFTEHAGGVVWATAAAPLAAVTRRGLDIPALVARMVCPTVSEVTGTATPFAGVDRLPGGHALIVEHDVPKAHRYEPEEQHADFDTAAEALRDGLVSAVRHRVQAAGRVTADFSGGLDSTSLALLAARCGSTVLAVTGQDSTSVNDDVSYARRAAATDGRIRHVVVAERGLFFDRLTDAPPTDQPYSDAARWAMRASFQRPILDAGSDLHLTGSGADTLLVAPPSYLADLASAGNTTGLLRHAVARARLRHLPVRSVLASAVRLSRTTYQQALRAMASDLRQPAPRTARGSRTSASVSWVSAASIVAWLTPAARTDLGDRVETAAEMVVDDVPAGVRRAWNELREFGAYQGELTAQQRASGIPAHAPFLDNAVVRAGMSIPVHLRQSTTTQKPLLGAALRGLVPDFILDRTTKGAYDGSGYTGIRANAATLRTLIDQSLLAAEGVIDPAVVTADLDRLLAGAPGRLASLETLITTELWIHQQAQAADALPVLGAARG